LIRNGELQTGSTATYAGQRRDPSKDGREEIFIGEGLEEWVVAAYIAIFVCFAA
jgi:hypothetical protein